MKLVIENTNILTMADADGCSTVKGSIGIEEDKIVFVGQVPEAFIKDADKVIDGTDTISMPGLVNAHTHMPMSILRNFANDLELMDWLNTAIFPAEDRMDEECGYYGALLSAAELIHSGCTSFEEQYMFAESIAKAAADAGIRGNISRGIVGEGRDDEGCVKRVQENVRLYENWHGKAEGRIRVDFGPHAPYTCKDGALELVAETVKSLPEAGIHIHLCETEFEVNSSLDEFGVTPVKRLENLGLLEAGRVVAAHGVHLTEEDIEILKKYNVTIVHNPSSNLKLASGFAPVAKLIAKGINVALGTDGSSSNNNVNMIEEMHIAGILAKAVAKDAKALPAYEVLKMATINGAKALGIDSLTGTLEAGKKADIAVLDMKAAHWYPKNDLVAALAYSAQGSDVRDVICNGRLLMEDRKILTFDEEAVKQKVQELAAHVVG